MFWKKKPAPSTSASDKATAESRNAVAAQFEGVRVLKHASAMRVIFFYPGEEGTYVDHPTVTLFENGIVHIRAKNEETTTHLQHCEILWRFEAVESEDKKGSKLRVVKFKPRKGAKDVELGKGSSRDEPIGYDSHGEAIPPPFGSRSTDDATPPPFNHDR